MRIYIPSRGRADLKKQSTFMALPKVLQKETLLVVPADEFEAYAALGLPTISPPNKATGIGPTRQWIVKTHHEHRSDPRLCMLDDDLAFGRRRPDSPAHFREMTTSDFSELFYAIGKQLLRYAHVTVCPREGGNRLAGTTALEENMRPLRVLAYNADVLVGEDIRFDDVALMEDFHVALSLMRKGYANALLTAWCQGQRQSNEAGGCSTYRTLKTQAVAARELTKLHAPHVRLVTKTTKHAWGGGERLDVVVAWKKAYAEGVARYGKRKL